MARRYASSSSDEEPVISGYSLRSTTGGILKSEQIKDTFRSSTPLTPLGGPEIQRCKTVSFDTPNKNVDGRYNIPGSASRYPRSPYDTLTARGARRSNITAATKRSKAPVNRLFSNIASKLAHTHNEDAKLRFGKRRLVRPET